MTEEPRYTLAEAQAELRRRECATRGHDFITFTAAGSNLPSALICERCGERLPVATARDARPMDVIRYDGQLHVVYGFDSRLGTQVEPLVDMLVRNLVVVDGDETLGVHGDETLGEALIAAGWTPPSKHDRKVEMLQRQADEEHRRAASDS